MVIVNWNTGPLLRSCLESIPSAVHAGLQLADVVVVDNASGDGSASNLPDFGLPLQFIENQENVGFGRACNQGARSTNSQYLLFLNPDTRLYAESLIKPLDFMESDLANDVAICGVQLVGDDGKFMPACARFPSLRTFMANITGLSRVAPQLFPGHLLTEAECKESRYVDQVIGAYFLIRREAFDLLAGFDERFFVYFEEVDLSLRARQKGLKSFFLSDASIYHKGEGSSSQVLADRLYYSLASRTKYVFKHFGKLTAGAILAMTWAIELPIRLLRSLLGGSGGTARNVINPYLRFGRTLLLGKAKCP